MKVVSAACMRDIDSAAIDKLGCPGEVLMGLAGKAVLDTVILRYPAARRIAVFAGTGNNGGDGFVAAYLLYNRDKEVTVFVAGDPDRYTKSTTVYARMCENSHITVKQISPETLQAVTQGSFDLILDALLGTGFSGTVRGIVLDTIKWINGSGTPVLSIDIPSGLPSDGQAPDSAVVQACCTVTMGLPKLSLVTWPGKKYCGDLVVADIGFPRSLTHSDDIRTELADIDYVRSKLPPPFDGDTHKGERGHLLLVGGFDGMEGAILMSAGAALQAGAGLVTILTTERAREIIAGIYPETMTLALPADDQLSSESLGDLLSSRKYNTAVLGPGMRRSAAARTCFDALCEVLPAKGVRRILVDGDGLYHLSDSRFKKNFPREVDVVLTPHFLEASRLCGISVADIRSNRPAAACRCAESTGCMVLLKGPASIVSDGDRMIINTTGNPAMATGGSGDVLSGIIGAFLLRDIPALDAAALGAFIHGRAGDMAAASSGIISATDITACIRGALMESAI